MVGVPRQLRIDYAGAIHQVMSPGDRRENIYHDDVERQDFLKTFAANRVGAQQPMHPFDQIRVWGFQHHMKVVTHQTMGMHLPIGLLTRRLNRRHETPGHVFSGRYKALVVEGDGRGYLKRSAIMCI